MSVKIDSISKTEFDDTLSRYPATVPEKLKELDDARYNTIPAAIADNQEDGDIYLQKDQVETLVEWKLKHGTFRPKLLQLVQSNPKDVFEETTKQGFQLLLKGPLPALKKLTELKGVGPATASLLLSVYDPEKTPFFSDELFRWCMWDEPGGVGWKRSIKYNAKEYEQLVPGVEKIVKRLCVRAVDVEKVAWVLGKEGIDVGKEAKGGENEKAEEAVEEGAEIEAVEEVVKAQKQTKSKKGSKRKAEDVKPAIEGTRKSSRRRTEVTYKEED